MKVNKLKFPSMLAIIFKLLESLPQHKKNYVRIDNTLYVKGKNAISPRSEPANPTCKTVDGSISPF